MVFNLWLEDEGYLETIERKVNGGVKKYKTLTEMGLEFGKNIVSPSNPRETQPHYYINKFASLVEGYLDYLGE